MCLSEDSLLQGGKYKIVRFLSSGGFGNTYEGVHTMMDTRVAIKEFFPKMFCNRDENTSHVTVATHGNRELVDKLRKKFNEEAKAVFQMNHPNIVRVLDIFEENGTAYYVMEFVDGKSLNEISKERGALPEAEAVCYIRQVADALKYVHSLNRLHLDIKPGNIMVDKNGKAILIDFGASKHYDDENGENTSTLMGLNTKGYAPIEQCTQGFSSFSPATDIYALGATLYKLLTGIVPPDANMLLGQEETLQPLPSNISSTTRNAVMAAMALLRKDRLKSVEEFVQSLCSKDVISYKLDSPVLGEDTLLDYSQKKRNETTTDSISYRNYSVALESIASEGDANAQKTLADCFVQGLGIDKNMVSALYWYSKAAEQGHIDAQYEMGICYEKGIGTEKDEKKAIYWYTKAAEQGNVAAMNSLGTIFFQSPNGSKKRIQASLWYKQAFDIYLQSAEQGDIESQRMLAKYYAEGLGIEIDKSRAEYWYTKVAAQGNVEDQKLLAKLYQNGKRILQNIDNAMGWYTKAAEQGDLASQRILAEYYAKTQIDFDKAEYWYSLAADQGHPEDYIALGNLLRDNDAQKSKLYLKKAFDLYSISAEQGDSWAQLQLGRLYKKGEGVKKDSSKAKYWFKRVIKQNDSNQNNAKEELKDYIWVGMGSIWKIIKCLCFCFISGFMTVVIASIFWKNIIEHPLFCVILFVLGFLSFMGYCLKNWGSWDK